MLLQVRTVGMARRLSSWLAGGGVALALLLGPTAAPLAAWAGLPLSSESCLCPPERCRCPHAGAVAHRPASPGEHGAAPAADHGSRPSCPLRAKRGGGDSGAERSAHGAAAHDHNTASAGGTAAQHAPSAARHGAGGAGAAPGATHAAVAPDAVAMHAVGSHAGATHAGGSRPVIEQPVASQAGAAPVVGSPAVASQAPPTAPASRDAGCSIASSCGGESPAGTGTVTWLQAAGGSGVAWAAPADRGSAAPPAASPRLLDTLRAPDPPPPRRTAPTA